MVSGERLGEELLQSPCRLQDSTKILCSRHCDVAKIVTCLLLKPCVPLVVGIDGVGLTDSTDLACVLENSYWFPCLVSQGSHRIHWRRRQNHFGRTYRRCECGSGTDWSHGQGSGKLVVLVLVYKKKVGKGGATEQRWSVAHICGYLHRLNRTCRKQVVWQMSKTLVLKLFLKNHQHILSLLMQRRKYSISVTAGEAFKSL